MGAPEHKRVYALTRCQNTNPGYKALSQRVEECVRYGIVSCQATRKNKMKVRVSGLSLPWENSVVSARLEFI